KGNDADGPIDPRRLEAADQLVHRAAPERVVALGPVDRDPRQSVVDLVHDVGQFVELHDVDTRWTCDGPFPALLLRRLPSSRLAHHQATRPRRPTPTPPSSTN